jgi:hypothetical protein
VQRAKGLGEVVTECPHARGALQVAVDDQPQRAHRPGVAWEQAHQGRVTRGEITRQEAKPQARKDGSELRQRRIGPQSYARISRLLPKPAGRRGVFSIENREIVPRKLARLGRTAPFEIAAGRVQAEREGRDLARQFDSSYPDYENLCWVKYPR